MSAGKSLARELLDAAVMLLVAALVFRWAWQLVHPFLPVLVFGALVYGFFRWQRR